MAASALRLTKTSMQKPRVSATQAGPSAAWAVEAEATSVETIIPSRRDDLTGIRCFPSRLADYGATIGEAERSD
ncbi:hypothetical protein FJ419_11335 [Mesorhizobium sp. B2-6-2]|nr:hypothetical protein FJ419_11335 [Mesorhizobium sp. B2-6-2]